MPLTPAAKKRALAAEEAALAVQKTEWRDKLEGLKALVVPPLSNAELSVGLGLPAPPPGQTGVSAVARFVSEAPRNRRARPDTATRALIELLLAGDLYLGVQPASTPGARRAVVVCSEQDLPWLGKDVQVMDGRGNRVGRNEDWDEGWDLFSRDTPRALERAPLLGRVVPGVGLGCMRLSTREDRDDAASIALIREAYALGVRHFDTADAYALDDQDVGHNERLLAQALADVRDDVVVASKVGLVRPQGRWLPDGNPARLVQAGKACAANGRVDLLYLHAVDRRFALEDSLGALARLVEDGTVGAVGVCNVDVDQLERARAVCDIAAVQCALSMWDTTAQPVAERCRELGIPFIAHSPFGGHRKARKNLAQRSAAEALAWLDQQGVYAIPGCTRSETLQDCVGSGDEVRLICGSPASGKTSRVDSLVDRGYLRLNRDERGGSLQDLLKPLDEALALGQRQVVMDNTYPTRGSRKAVLDVAARYGVPVTVTRIEIPQEEALFNAAKRMLERQGRLLSPDEIKAVSRTEPNLFPPRAVFAFGQRDEPPSLDEGFKSLEQVHFSRRDEGYSNRAIICDLDGTVRTSKPAPFPRRPEEIRILPNRRETLRRYADDGWILLGITNQAGVAMGQLSEQDVRDCIDRTVELLGVDIDVRYCPHRAGGTHCWCRKPMPGLGVQLIQEYELDRTQCIFVGDRKSDAEFAKNVGFQYQDQAEFFGE